MTLRVAVLEGQEDHDATWMLGHTERIEFGRTYTDDGHLWAEARVHVPCRHLSVGADGVSHCRAHGFRGRTTPPQPAEQPRRLGGDRFRVVEGRRLVNRRLEQAPAPKRSLPLHQDSAPAANPCATALCRTADGKLRAACCRDLQVEILCHEEQELLEDLLRHRKAPYLCKVEREDEDEPVVNAEILSACRYLMDDGIHCSLHGRSRADGRPAKPTLCTDWPKSRTGLHPGCAFRSRKVPL